MVENEYLKMDLKALKAQACQQLKEERSKSLTLLQKRESGPAKSEADLLQSIQELTLKLQHSETLIKVLGSGPPERPLLVSSLPPVACLKRCSSCSADGAGEGAGAGGGAGEGGGPGRQT